MKHNILARAAGLAAISAMTLGASTALDEILYRALLATHFGLHLARISLLTDCCSARDAVRSLTGKASEKSLAPDLQRLRDSSEDEGVCWTWIPGDVNLADLATTWRGIAPNA